MTTAQYFTTLTNKTKFSLWNKYGREHGDPNIWLAQFLSYTPVDKNGRSLALREFSTTYLAHYKEEHGITRHLTSKERKDIAHNIKWQLHGWVKPGGGSYYIPGT